MVSYECVFYEGEQYTHTFNRSNQIVKKYRNNHIASIINITDDMFYENKKPTNKILFFNMFDENGEQTNTPLNDIYFTSFSSVKKYWRENYQVRLNFDVTYSLTGFLHTSRIDDEDLITHII